MAKKYTYNSDPLDELLEKLNSGDFVDQSMHEFSNTVKGYSDSKRKRGTTNSYTRSTYSTVRPRIKSDVEVRLIRIRSRMEIHCQPELERSAVIREFNLGIRNPVNHLHTDIEALHHRMDGIIVGSHTFLLVLRKELHEITHVHKGHIKLIWGLGHNGILALIVHHDLFSPG